MVNIISLDEMLEQEQEQQQVGENGNPTTDKKNLSEQVTIICFSWFS